MDYFSPLTETVSPLILKKLSKCIKWLGFQHIERLHNFNSKSLKELRQLQQNENYADDVGRKRQE